LKQCINLKRSELTSCTRSVIAPHQSTINRAASEGKPIACEPKVMRSIALTLRKSSIAQTNPKAPLSTDSSSLPNLDAGILHLVVPSSAAAAPALALNQ
jgi:hypothetical protein